MMKFMLRQVKNGCRLGQFIDLPKEVGDKAMDTPMCMLYTKAGSVPYLGRDVLDKIDKHPAFVNMPIALLAENHDAIADFPGGIKKFSAMDDFSVYCSLQDPAAVTPSGYNTKKNVSVWSRHGKYQLDVPSYVGILSALHPEWAQCLCDSDTDINSSRKRVTKSVDRSLDYLDQLVVEQQKSEKLQSIRLIGTIEGGYLEDLRLRSAKETAKRPVAGFSVEGFQNFGPETERFNLLDIKDLLSKTLTELPTDKPRILPGLMNPGNLLHAIELGFDMFESSYVYVVSERGVALCYDYTHWLEGRKHLGASTGKKTWEMDLTDQSYKEDTRPLVEHCTCYTCTKHTRAYINHLLNVSELLGKVLLNIHNIHHYLRTFEAIRQAIADGTFSQFKEHIIAQNSSS